jgi:hypothetical protein
MYSRHHLMPRHRGGLTGFGYGGSLGGLLLGGAYKKVSELTPEQHAERLRKAAEYRARRKQEGYVPAVSKLTGRRVKPSRGPRYKLTEFMDAELDAADLEEREGHPQLARVLADDYMYNVNLYDSGKIPAWLRSKYTKTSGWYDKMARAKRDLEGAPIWIYTSSSGKRTQVKEGSATFDKIARMKRVQEDPSVFQRVA